MRLLPLLLLLSTAVLLPADVAVLKGHTRDVNAVACSADGSLLVSGGDDGAVVLWNAVKREKVAESKGDAVLAVAVSADAKRAAAGERYNKIRLLDASGGAAAKTLEGHTAAVIAVQFVDNKSLLSMAKDGGIRAWDANTGSAQGVPQRIPDALDAAAFTADGKWAVGGAGSFVYLQNLALKKLAWKASQPVNTKAVAITPDGKLVAAGLNSSVVVLLDAASGKEVGRIEGVDANGLAFSADGAKLVAAGHDNQVHLIDVAARKVASTWKGHEGTVRAVCVVPGAPQIAVSGSADMTLRLFPIE